MTTSDPRSTSPRPTSPWSSRPAVTTGVARPPLNLTPRAVAALCVGSVALVALLFALASGPLSHAVSSLAPPGTEPEATATSDADGSDFDGGMEDGIDAASPRSVTAPRPPTWSLLQVSEGAHAVADEATALIAAGRSELSELKDPDVADAGRAERARRQWTAWARIWLNRVAVVEKKLPPSDACAVHAAMEPACRTLRRAVDELRAVADETGLEAARARLDAAETAVGVYLEPAEPVEDVGDEVDPAREADGAPETRPQA